ncbi:hypothetical protein BJ165DRAFT_697825 [Panaeolus papilionaceus]|nr:hypothetical protein BJ165DRAFT_697825 [Panaeolus papilionaceus]
MATLLCSKRLLEGNICPSEEEEVAIRGHLSELTKKSAVLDEEIAQLLGHLQSLQRTRSALQGDIALHRPIISTARRIPFEILEQILFHCLPETRNPTMSTMDAPLKYARVCSYWRSVVYQSPRLWTRLHLAVPASLVRPAMYGGLPSPPMLVGEAVRKHDINLALRRMRTAMEWLERGLHYPVSISVSCGSHDYVLSEVLDIMWDTVLSFAERWADIDIELPFSPNNPFDRIRLLSPENTPHLRSLRLTCLVPGALALTAPLNWFKTELFLAPNLEALHLIGIPGAYNVETAWSQITELTIEDCDLPSGDAERILSESPNLRHCRLHISRPSLPTQTVDRPIIHLVHLESFTLIERRSFTANIRAPNLKRFAYEAYRYDREHFDMFELIRDQEGYPTGHSLEVLILDPTTILPETITEFLSLAPNVKELYLETPSTHLGCVEWKWNSRSELGDGFLSALIPAMERPRLALKDMENEHTILDSRSTLCPKLQIFRCTTRVGFTDETLLAFVRSRLSTSMTHRAMTALEPNLQSCLPLRQVVVKFDRPATVDIVAELRGKLNCSSSTHTTATGIDLRLMYKEVLKQSSNSGQLSPWKGIRSREAVPEWITCVGTQGDLL